MNISDLQVILTTGINVRKTHAEVFAEKVNKDQECWLWAGALYPNGYGRFNIRDNSHLAHRISYILSNGTIPEGKVVRHTCDVRACVNPEHLLLGTQADNMQDAVDRGRMKPCKGDKSGMCKLDWSRVSAMRLGHAQGRSQKSLSKEFGISQKQVSVIVNNKQWVMDADAYQSLCLDTCIYPNLGDNPVYPALALAGEVGEVAGKIKKVLRGDYDLDDEKKDQVLDELGDCLFYTAALAFELGGSLSEVMKRNLDKLQSRKERNVLQGDGDNR